MSEKQKPSHNSRYLGITNYIHRSFQKLNGRTYSIGNSLHWDGCEAVYHGLHINDPLPRRLWMGTIVEILGDRGPRRACEASPISRYRVSKLAVRSCNTRKLPLHQLLETTITRIHIPSHKVCKLQIVNCTYWVVIFNRFCQVWLNWIM